MKILSIEKKHALSVAEEEFFASLGRKAKAKPRWTGADIYSLKVDEHKFRIAPRIRSSAPIVEGEILDGIIVVKYKYGRITFLGGTLSLFLFLMWTRSFLRRGDVDNEFLFPLFFICASFLVILISLKSKISKIDADILSAANR